MAFEQITLTKEDDLGLIMLNRPEKLNAWTRQMMAEMTEALTACNADPAIGAVVISGTGRAFCSGADIGGFQQRLHTQHAGESVPGDNGVDLPAFVDLLRQGKPTIAAVNGAAVGVGVTQILPMDIRVCSTAATFGFFFIRMGLVPEFASSALLPQLVGMGRAREWCLTGRLVMPDEALATGLVTHVFEPGALLPRAKELARQITDKSRTAALAIKEILDANALAQQLSAVHRSEQAMLERCFQSWEHREAVAAFLEKRPPDFTPRS
jgi:2-(1,2-epoxy-1,2-dihydrophenyl)acetyl-CoA isomerase